LGCSELSLLLLFLWLFCQFLKFRLRTTQTLPIPPTSLSVATMGLVRTLAVMPTITRARTTAFVTVGVQIIVLVLETMEIVIVAILCTAYVYKTMAIVNAETRCFVNVMGTMGIVAP